jgi:hypothetical protein
LNVTVVTDRSQIAPDESLTLYVQVTNVGVVNATNITDVKNITVTLLPLPEGFTVQDQDGHPFDTSQKVQYLDDLIPNQTNYTYFRINANSSVIPNNYTVMVFVNSTNAPRIVTSTQITVVSKLGSIIDRQIPSTTLQTLFFITILGGLASAGITWYFNNRAKDKETYIKSLDELKEFAFKYYIPIAGYAQSFASHLKIASDDPCDSKIEYSFYMLAIYFSLKLEFHSEKGGVIKLQSYKQECISEVMRKEGMESLTCCKDYEISIMQKYVPYKTKFLDFRKILSQKKELMDVYKKFRSWVRRRRNRVRKNALLNETNEVQNVIESFSYYGEYLQVQTTQMFSAWYKREGLEEMIQIIIPIVAGILGGIVLYCLSNNPLVGIVTGFSILAIVCKAFSMMPKAKLTNKCCDYIEKLYKNGKIQKTCNYITLQRYISTKISVLSIKYKEIKYKEKGETQTTLSRFI